MAVEGSLATEVLVGELNEIERKYDPGPLFTSGNLEFLQLSPRISVIGSRNASPHGLEAARIISEAIVERNGVVVSGLARGVDTVAHQTAIASGGKTIAVLGNGIDVVYPKENADLQQGIADNHLVISQFSAGTPPRRGNFPSRNKAMAWLSHGSIIIEAEAHSGTMHQGWMALRLGRPLLFPRQLLKQNFSWPREMQEYGAIAFQLDRVNSWLDQVFWQ